jgi:hypothetical protein
MRTLLIGFELFILDGSVSEVLFIEGIYGIYLDSIFNVIYLDCLEKIFNSKKNKMNNNYYFILFIYFIYFS